MAIYFGRLPDYIGLWLQSCAANPGIDWLLICDQPGRIEPPGNVTVHRSSLDEIRAMLSEALGFAVALPTAYKLCDFRPVYWTILDRLGWTYDYWGHCDVDVYFGRLLDFVGPPIRAGYDRIFGLGHLSILRNSPLAKLAFALPSRAPAWRAIFTRGANFGFDEHRGVNRTWRAWRLRYHEDESVVADIDPGFDSPRLAHLPGNRRGQVFGVDATGAVVQRVAGSPGAGRAFAYLHFQKRAMRIGVDSAPFLVARDGFVPWRDGVRGAGLAWREWPRLARAWLRFFRKRCGWVR